ncbi:MAG: hypothetical protein AB7O57_15450 [Hyphomicrobiaceae bacterium]
MTDRTAPPLAIRLDATLAGRGLSEDRGMAGTADDAAADPIECVRLRLEIEDDVPDVTIAASLAQIAARGDVRGRWLAAFGSPLGKHMAVRGSDLNAALNVLLALAPRHQS